MRRGAGDGGGGRNELKSELDEAASRRLYIAFMPDTMLFTRRDVTSTVNSIESLIFTGRFLHAYIRSIVNSSIEINWGNI